MRRILTLMTLTLMVLGVGLSRATTANAGPDETRAVIPLSYAVPGVNPCTGEQISIHLSGEIQIHALPSVEAFLTGGAVRHATVKWVMEASTSDGYTAPRQHFATLTVNDREGDMIGHVAVTETDNWMYGNGDGSKYEVAYRHHVTVIDGRPIVVADSFDVRCVHHSDS
jgi:hypothetical protein